MDRVSTGKFIAKVRNEKNISQEELAEMVGVSNRTISSWERGISFPALNHVDLLCHSLDITVNDLLNGEIIPQEKRKAVSEMNLAILKTSQERLIKVIIRIEAVLYFICFFVLLSSLLYLILENSTALWHHILDIVIMALSVLSLGFLNLAESKAVTYICPNCNTEFKQKLSWTILSIKGQRRFMQCPHCKKYHWMSVFIP